jgi:type IV pilus assembly protein PilM
MASRSIGLDVGTHGVRAVEVAFGRGRPVLHKVGQVSLPYGAVVGGEVADPPAVAAAVRRLWKEVGFKARSAVVGVANQRVVARIADVPAMPDEELRSSLRFQVQDLIPMPIDEAILDYQVVEQFTGPDGLPMMRILLVAAHRDMIRSLLAALDGANVNASRIDLVPFALIRALHDPMAYLGTDPLDDGGMAPDAIIGIGAGVTNVIIHENGMPRFVRSLTSGGNSIVEAIAEDQGVDTDIAEDLKRRSDPLSTDDALSRAGRTVSNAMTPLLEEVRGSLEFYLAQAGGDRLGRVVVTGGASRMPGVADRLGGMLGVPVAYGNPFSLLELGKTGLDDDVIAASADVLAVPLGLALSGQALGDGGRRITLLPGEIGVRRRERRQMILAGAGVAAFAGLLVGGVVVRDAQVEEAQQAATQEEARTGPLQAEVASFQEVADLQADIAERRQTVSATLEGDVAWTRLIQEVATVIPNDVWLTSFTGTAGTGDAPGTVQVSAMGFDQTSSARWLLRVGELESVDQLWLPSSTKSPAEGSAPELVTFSSDAKITPAAGSDRLQRYLEEDPS